MTSTTSAERRATSAAEASVAGARSGFEDTVDAVRSTASSVGDRLPEVIETVRSSATDGARSMRAWPESRQRLAAAFSLGLGVGLTLAGAPRVAIAGALVPLVVVAATIIEHSEGAA